MAKNLETTVEKVIFTEGDGDAVLVESVNADPVVLTPYTDAAEFNAVEVTVTAGLPVHELDLIGSTIRDNKVLPLGANVPGTVNWQIDSGAALTPHKGVITFSFLDSGHTTGMYNQPQEGFTEGFGYTSFSTAQRAAARISIQNWDDLIKPTFKEVNGDGNADITMANTTTGPAQAHAYVPYDYAGIYSEVLGPKYHYLNRWEGFLGDVWVASPSVNPSNAQLLPGQYGLQTLNHELGHSLGLSHPGTYDFGDDNDGDGVADPISYTGDAQYFQDSHQYTIMSYFDSYETGAQPIDWNLMRFIYPSTPMIHDVAVIQAKYGADYTTRAGNTTYGFNATADVKNEAMRFHDGEMLTIFTIWDGGGNDTLDLSGYYTDSIIDLRPGAFSSAGGAGAYDPTQLNRELTLAEINANNAEAGFGNRTERLHEIYYEGNYYDLDEDGNPTILVNEGHSWKEITGTTDQFLMEDNIGIAYGAIIENAKGGHGNDRINGNSANNQLTGGAGADTFIFVKDASTDSIMDFQTGTDKIDLTELTGVDAGDVLLDSANDRLRIDTNNDGVHDMTINVYGSDAVVSDILFG